MKKDKIVNKKIKHLIKHFGFHKNQLQEVKKMYSGEFFDKNDKSYIRLLECSKEICERYSIVVKEEMRQKSLNRNLKLNIFTYLKFYFKKSRILKLIFPIHGFILYAEEGIQAVIGLVDLKGYGFINKNVIFTPNSLVEVKKSNILAFNITIGDEQCLTQNNLSKLSIITIDKNCWIGAGVKIFGGITIGRNSVIGVGSKVSESISEFSLAVGRPCKTIRKITDNDRMIFDNRIAVDIDKNLIDNIKKINRGDMPKSYENMIECKPFNSMDKNLSYMYNLTKMLCFELNNSPSPQRKEEILDILFVGHGENFKVESDIYVDMLGTVRIGKNVTIGKDVFLGGNVTIGDNVTIENGAILFASGHSLLAKERMMNFSLKNGFYEFTQYQTINVNDNNTIGQNAIITPNSTVKTNIPANRLFAKNKLL